MAVYDLDKNEKIDDFTINWVEYQVGEIPIRIIEKIMQIKVWLFTKDEELLKQWKPICKELLEVRNQNVNIDNIQKEKLLALITYIRWKIEKQQYS
jgi:hypothetical protein